MRKSLLAASALCLAACGQGGPLANPNEPTAAQVDEYLEKVLPRLVDVEDVKIESFIDPTTKEGRVSSQFAMVLKEPLYRRATWEEIDARYTEAGFGQRRERALYKSGEPIFLTQVTADGYRVPLALELRAIKRVEGWDFAVISGTPIPTDLKQGDDLSAFGEKAAPLDSEIAQAYFDGLTAQRGAAQGRDEALFQAFQKRFPLGKPITIRLTHPNSGKVTMVRLTPDKGLEKTQFDDGTHSVWIAGPLQHLDAGYNMTCSSHGGPSFRSPYAKIVANEKRTMRNGIAQPYYELEFAAWDPGSNQYCAHSQQKSRFENGQVMPGTGLYYQYWEVL